MAKQKHSIHQKLRVLKAWVDDLNSNRKVETQPKWLKQAMQEHGK